MSLESTIATAEKKIFINHKENKEQSPIQSLEDDSRIVLPNIQGACLSASATVEASLVIPFFIYAVMAVMYIMQMILVQVHVQESLYNESRKIAKYVYLQDCMEKGLNDSKKLNSKDEEVVAWLEKGFSVAAIQAMFIQEIGTDYAKKSGIAGGNAGYIMLGSKVMEGNDDIVLEVRYVLKNPFDIFGIALKNFTQRAVVTAWLGSDDCSGVSKSGASDSQNNEYVYVTSGGTVYHTNRSCTYLKPSLQKVGAQQIADKRNENGEKYYRCEYCVGKMKQDSSLYITSYGNRWHVSEKCPKVSRCVMKVLKSSVADMKKCSKCALSE
ncbi:MAG: hypothetical protein PUE71_07835 [Clostridia bacterium]|nr:hypothetical protein [Clostridia bacterium]